MLYLKLAETYDALGKTTKRLQKIDILSRFLEYLPEKDKEVLYLLNGEIYPNYDERKIGISNQLAIKAISKASGMASEKVIQEWKKIGDLGKVAEKLTQFKKQSTLFLKSHLTTDKVIDSLRKLPELEGEGTVDKKINIITDLLTSASPLESLYITRTLIGDLRIGIQESTIRESLSKAFFNSDKESSKIIQEAIDNLNDIAEIFIVAKKGKISEFEKIEMQVGKPIKAMLAQKAKNIEEGFKAVGVPCAIEYKYDGFRLIIHKKNAEIKLFTRSLENVTKQFPEVIEYVQKYVKGDSFILDSEAIGYNKKTKEYTPFQAISQRIRRKYDIEKVREELPIEINVFDILHYNGKSLIKEPFEKRAQLIRRIIKETPYKIISSKQIITDDLKKAEEFYKKALKDNQEGVMMKNLSAVYQPGNRVGHMLKIKPSERDLDLVITGAEYGTGKRSGWLSSFTLSCKGKEEGKYLEVGKVGTGIKEKDEQEGVSFNELNNLLKPLIIKEEGKDVKIIPKIVVSITYQEIQQSPNYSSGWALRFPRITALRPDKPLSEIARLEEIEMDVENQRRK
jgi:DNA ligase-1